MATFKRDGALLLRKHVSSLMETASFNRRNLLHLPAAPRL
jgi:hypothetical protein